MADTGHGATLTLSGNTNSFQITSITVGSQSVAAIDVTHLGTTTDKEYIPGDVLETPEIVATVLFNVGVDLPAPATPHTATVTFPLGPAQTTTNKATFAGTGFVMERTYPELVTDTVQSAQFTIKMDGGTGPTFTVGA